MLGGGFILFVQPYLGNEKTSGLLLVFLPFAFIAGGLIANQVISRLIVRRLLKPSDSQLL